MDHRFLADMLPHDVILDEPHGVVLLSTPRPLRSALAVGCVWEVVPRNVEVAEDAVCLDLARQHTAMLRGLPIGAALQVLWTLPPVTRAPGWEALRAALPLDVPYRPLLESQVAAIRAGLPHADGPRLHHLRQGTTLVTLRLPLRSVSPALGALLRALLNTPARTARTITALLADHLAEHLIQVESAALGVQESLRAAGHGVQRLTGQGIATALARALDPLAEEVPALHPELPLRHQARTRDGITPDLNRWVFPHDAVPLATQVLSLHQAPPQTYPGMLSSSRAPANVEPLALWDVWPGPLTMAANIASPSADVEKGRLQRRLAVATMQQALSVENRKLKGQLEALLGTLFVSGGGVTWGRIHLVAWGAPDRVQQETPALIRAPRRLGLEFAPEPVLGSTLFLQTLPLGFDPDFPAESSLQRGRRLSQENLVDLLPLYGAFHGTVTAHLRYLNRRGEAMPFSIFDAVANKHVLVKGSPGAGKSFAMGDLLNNELALGASAVILDRLPSYADLCQAWGGRNLVMDFNQPICWNPFFGPLDDAHVASITAIVAHMASGGLALHALDREHLGVLASAVGSFAHAHRGGAETTLGAFVREGLMDGAWTDDSRTRLLGRNIARRLGQFVGKGPYARFTDGPNQLELDPVLTVVEFSKLREAADLQGVLLLALMHLLTVFYEDPVRRAQRKYFICDEVWALLKDDMMADLMKEIAVTYRKLGVSFVFLSQLAEHFATGAGAVLRNVAQTKLFLSQVASELSETQAVFNLSPPEMALFERGEVARHAAWSSAYLQLEGGTGGVIRLVPDPVTRWLLTQTPEEQRLRAEAIAKHDGAVWPAVAQLAAQYPQGVR